MTTKENILQELNELNSNLSGINELTTYSVPEGYFNGLAQQVLSRIKAMEAKSATDELHYLSPLLSSLPKETPYSVPAGYFQELETTLLHSIQTNHLSASEELASLSPLLSGLDKKMPYRIPQDYFNTLVENKTPVPVKETATVISIKRRWTRYAVAAAITGIIAISGFLVLQSNTNSTTSIAKIENSINKEISKTSDSTLTAFIQQFGDAGLTGDENAYNEPDTDLKDLLKDIPETELKRFLDETGDNDLFNTESSILN